MKKFCVVIEEVISEEFEIEAESKEDAIEKAIEKYYSCEFVLCPGNLEHKQLAVLDENDKQIEDNAWVVF